MKLSSFTVIIGFIAAALIGCCLVGLLPVKLAPARSLPSITVSYSMPGSSARTVESEVTSRIESILARVGGVKNISSKSYSEGGRITLELDKHADIATSRFEISTLLRQAWSSLPDGVSYPVISLRGVDKANAGPFMTFTVNAPANPAEIQALVEERFKPLLGRVPGVEKVELSGAQPLEWKLIYDADQLNALHISPQTIRNAIAQHFGEINIGMGNVASSSADNRMQLILLSNTVSDFDPAAIDVPIPSGGSVPLSKLVSTVHTEKRPRGLFRINGLNSIYVNVSAANDANQLALSKEVQRAASRFASLLPQGYMIDCAYNATDTISEELNKIYFRTGLTVIILLLFVGVVSWSLRYVLMITIGLSINLAVAVMFYYIVGVEIQLYSLAGITVSLNLVIDNLIVMADHYMRHRSRSAFTAILAATLTTMGALSVVYFLDEATRLSLMDFVTVVIINLAVSLAVALLLVPALIERMGMARRQRSIHSMRRRLAVRLSSLYECLIQIMLRHRWLPLTVLILSFGLPVFMLPGKFDSDSLWSRAYNASLGSDFYNENIRPIADVALGGTLRLFVKKVYNGSNWERAVEEPVLIINATLPNGATLEQMDLLVKKMERILSGHKEIRQFQTSIQDARHASISVYFKPEHRYSGFPYILKSEVVEKALTLGGGAWSVYGLEDMGFNNDIRENAGSYRIKLSGYNYDELSDWAYRLRDTLLTHRRIKEVTVASEFSYWKDDYSEFHLVPDRDKLARAGITASQLFETIEPTFGREISCGRRMIGNTLQYLSLYSRQSDDYDVYSLMHRPFSVNGKMFKLSELASLERRQAPQDIVKKNQEYIICIQYEYIGSNMQGERVLNEDLETINSLMPIGYKAESEQMQWKDRDQTGNYWLILLIAAIIFFITSIQFNSLRQPSAIIFIIPASFIGVFAIFYLCKLEFDQGGFASFILLAGITVNAAIYIIDEFNTRRAASAVLPPLKVYMQAFRVKIVPILLTVLSTVLGFIPFIIGKVKEPFWYPLAVGTMGGLIMSLLAIVIYLPLFTLPRKQ